MAARYGVLDAIATTVTSVTLRNGPGMSVTLRNALETSVTPRNGPVTVSPLRHGASTGGLAGGDGESFYSNFDPTMYSSDAPGGSGALHLKPDSFCFSTAVQSKLAERCPPRQTSSVERLKAKEEPRMN